MARERYARVWGPQQGNAFRIHQVMHHLAVNRRDTGPENLQVLPSQARYLALEHLQLHHIQTFFSL